ncbi:myotubularin-related protein 3 isoform X2 [Trichomycterus rosablanca]|uniref:myotubularin-related protein 3 isoform X2 n=1 Tax=Trichomycterus rosablanca TaxID=2290929 RepID=UPI002F35E2F3
MYHLLFFSKVKIQQKDRLLSGAIPSCTPSLLGAMGEEEQPSPEAESPDLEKEHLQVPFPVLHGECLEYVEKTEGDVIALSSYRLYVKVKENVINVPLQLIESVECRDLVQLHLSCKDGKVIRGEFTSSEQAQDWLRRLAAALHPPSRLEELFAFSFHTYSASVPAEQDLHDEICHAGEHVRNRSKCEMYRMGFDTHSAWRISEINTNYRLCMSYPEKLVVPSWITDKELEKVAEFRSWKRIPAVVYRHQSTGAIIGRCGQPEVSWWGWRSADDEHLVQSIAKACAVDTAANKHLCNGFCVHHQSDGSPDSSDPVITNGNEGMELTATPQKLLILDARSYAAAVANRAKGGGCECPEYYPNCEVVFMSMANIHSIRRSFQCLRALCAQVPDPANWLSALEGTKWLQHLSLLLKASLLVVNTVDRDSMPVLVHCSDGWDRTPQIVALSKLLLDPYYRTIEGFQVLVETEWLDFGHKFADRCGHGENSEDVNERCPVFLQWLDCVHQLQRQFPCSFQFNEAFLVKLVQHTYSCLFGTFLCNSVKEREEQGALENTCSVWSLLQPANRAFHNILYSSHSEMVLHPVCHVRNLMLWSAVYLPNSAPSTLCEESCASYSAASASPEDTRPGRLSKTRSYDNLPVACQGSNLAASNRRSSDPNLNESWQDHLRSEELVAATESKDNSQQAVRHTTDHTEMNEFDGSLAKTELLNDCNLVNGSDSVNENVAVPFSNTSSSAAVDVVLSDKVPVQNGDNPGNCSCEHANKVLEPSTDKLCISCPDHITNTDSGTESKPNESPKEPLCPDSTPKPNTISPPQDFTETEECLHSANPPSSPHSPSLQPLFPKSNHELSACNGEASSVDGGCISQTPLSRQTSTASAGSPSFIQDTSLGGFGRVPAVPDHLGEDGLSVHRDVVQVRLRQMEAGHQLQVETLKRQVQALWNRLHVNGELTPVPDGENNVEVVHLSRCGNEQDEHDKQVPRWYPDHLPTHCYRCENKFWLSARKTQCRNCGNVFCASCCDHKASATNQQLYEPNRVCQACYGNLHTSAVHPVLPPADLELEKPIAASSN